MPPFRAKARAVDLLGKGQIADLPTAICELWKNGYDAYADDLSCDLYLTGYKGLKSPIFTLSDDGIGMTGEDLIKRWIVLGTDSKVRGPELLQNEERLGKPVRTPMGEKGIGRLSVAYLGNKMLMLTKKPNENCFALFMDWRILENYNLYLDDVNVPIKEIFNSDISNDNFYELIDEFRQNLNSGDWSEHKHLANDISKDLNEIQFPDFLKDEGILKKILVENKHGTIFVIFDPHTQLSELSYGSNIILKDDDATNYLRTSLSGIYNSFKDEKTFETRFWIHDVAGKYDLISKQDFFTREDMFGVDHWLTGSFDENGFFSGEVQVFNKRFRHTFKPTRPPGATPYGSLKIEFGFIEGDAKNSILPREKWDELYSNKFKKFGGLYVYRDQFRVLPYGRADYDFLRFEERRSQSAGYYQFSHRRIVGYIEISREKNPKLKDKAGREGFIVNQAYREFREDLISFFVDLSKKYFRTVKDGVPTLRQEQVDLIKKNNEKVLKAEKKREKVTTTSFNRELIEKSQKIDQLNSEIAESLKKLNYQKEMADIVYNEISSLISEIEDGKLEIKKMKISEPKRITLTNSQKNKFYEYLDKYAISLELVEKCNMVLSEVQSKFSEDNLSEEFFKKANELQKDIVYTVKEYDSRFISSTRNLSNQISEDIKNFEYLFVEGINNINPTGGEDKEEIKNKIGSLEIIHTSLKEEIEEKYHSFIKHVEGLSFDIDDDLLVGWYKEQYEQINTKVEAMHELAQLGMAIEIIDHQFNVLYSEMSASIDFFNRFARNNPEVEYNYKQLRESFEHLETNHKLLTPLYRTMRRSKTEIKGSDIKEYLRNFFIKRFERHQIIFDTSPSFNEYIFFTYESVIKPVFINIVNNAIYWLTPSKERIIHITYEDGKILIMNSGEKIEPAYLETIFALFVSKRPDGRGIGLYLAKTNLHTIGYEIYATNDKKLNRLEGSCFVIEEIRRENARF